MCPVQQAGRQVSAPRPFDQLCNADLTEGGRASGQICCLVAYWLAACAALQKQLYRAVMSDMQTSHSMRIVGVICQLCQSLYDLVLLVKARRPGHLTALATQQHGKPDCQSVRDAACWFKGFHGID